MEDFENKPTKIQVTLDGVTQEIVWDSELSLLHALLKSGIQAPFDCGRGMCGTCVCRLNEGQVDLRRNYVLSDAHVKDGLILACSSKHQDRNIKINFDEL